MKVSTALVLAAGHGTRLRSRTPKPLLEVLGVPLLARTLFTLQRAGVADAFVVLGYEADRVQRGIERIARLEIRVRWLYNERWEEPNGVSVLAAESALDEPFILTMCDHLFDPAVVTALQTRGLEPGGINLAVDYDASRVLDLEDATKVQLQGDRIAAIGKSLATYDAIDTGVFLATPALFAALRDAGAESRRSLSDGVQKLARAGLARVTDIGDRMWQDIDTQRDVALAERKLLAGVRKSTDGPVARYINRPISTAVSRQLVKTAITPNQISVGTLVIGLVAAGFAAAGGYVPFLVSAILFQIASILDGSDGEVAKLTFQSSLRGEWIDTVCDNTSYVAYLGGLIVGVTRADLSPFYLWTGVLGLVSASLSMVNIWYYLLKRKQSGSALAVRYAFHDGTGWFSRVLRVLQYLGKRDFLAFLALVLAAFGQMSLALPLFGFGATLLLLPVTASANLQDLWQRRAAPPGVADAVLSPKERM